MRWGLGFGRGKKKKREWLGVRGVQIEGLCRGKVLPSFFFFPLLSLLITGGFYCRHLRHSSCGKVPPVVSSTNCSRAIQRLRSWSTLWVRPLMMSSLPAVATSREEAWEGFYCGGGGLYVGIERKKERNKETKHVHDNNNNPSHS